ncbi:MAG: TIGR03663 family protein [Bdellovibrionaceae bacterium]|nr:TIGR03663 family protein [Pseudobdellovibrionaceae bacterium]
MKDLIKSKESRLWMLASAIFVLVACFLRFVLLDNKPIHFDESINMWFVKRIWEEGFFTYDPTNYHGPLYFYLVHMIQIFTGYDFLSTRWVASIFSVLTLVILWWGPVAQRRAFRWAAVFLLISPAMAFYGRSGIHESTFVFFQVLGFLAFHYWAAGDFKKFWWTFVASMLGMMALKETFVILMIAFVPAAGLAWLLNRKSFRWSTEYGKLKETLLSEGVKTPLIFMLLLFVGLFTGFGGNPKGIVDFFVALMPWLKTGVNGAGHNKPFLHWAELMYKNEFAIVAGFVVALVFAFRSKWILFYATFALANFVIYSLIPYKTPWCIITILWPFAVLAGFGMKALLEHTSKSTVVESLKIGVLVGVAVLFSGGYSIIHKIQYNDPIDMDHPYVYVNSTYQMKEFISKIQSVVLKNPLLREKVIQIGAEESWPFPVVFYKFFTLKYEKYDVLTAPDGVLYIVDPKDQEFFESKLGERKNDFKNFLLETRQGRAKTLVYVQADLFGGLFSWPLSKIGEL